MDSVPIAKSYLHDQAIVLELHGGSCGIQKQISTMAHFQLAPLDLKTTDDWQRWRRRFEQYHAASGLAKDNAKKQVSTLLYCIGEESESVLASSGMTDYKSKNDATIVKEFDDYLAVRHNVIFEFNRCNQMEGESAEEYIRELPSTCRELQLSRH